MPKFKYWLLQYKCYAAMVHHLGPELLGGHPTPTAPPLTRLRALFMNGDYSHGKDRTDDPVQSICWEQEFEAHDLEQFWGSVLEHVADTRLEPTHERTDAPEPPAF